MQIRPDCFAPYSGLSPETAAELERIQGRTVRQFSRPRIRERLESIESELEDLAEWIVELSARLIVGPREQAVTRAIEERIATLEAKHRGLSLSLAERSF